MANINGTSGNDNLIGTGGSDVITALGGNDSVLGDGGADTIDGGDGDDALRGGTGNDLIRGGAGENELWGDAGNDTLDGSGGTGYAVYLDAPVGVSADLQAGTAADGQGGIDTLIGLAGVAGSQFNDTLRGDAGNNEFAGLLGNDSIDGRGGFDTVYYDNFDDTSSAGVSVDLSTGLVTGGWGNDTLVGIEAVVGTELGDTLIGSAGADALYGEYGDDRLTGGAGADTLQGGMGTDRFRYFVGSDLAGDVIVGGDQGGGVPEQVLGFVDADRLSSSSALGGESSPWHLFERLIFQRRILEPVFLVRLPSDAGSNEVHLDPRLRRCQVLVEELDRIVEKAVGDHATEDYFLAIYQAS